MKEQRYIKINSIYQRIKQAEAEHICIYIHAPVGVGKTAAVRYYFRDRKCLWLTGKIGFLYAMPELFEIEEEVIIVDDISWITDKKSQEYICNLVKQQEKQVVLIGRSRTPKWLMGEFTSGNLYLADESTLLLNKLQLERMLKAYGCTCTDEETEQILEDTKGFALAVIMMIPHIQLQGRYDPAVREDAQLDCFHYYDEQFFDLWDRDMRNMLLCVAEFDSFDAELAKMAAVEPRASYLLEYACGVGDFLMRNTDGSYFFRPQLKRYLLWKRDILMSEGEKSDVHKNASIYYEIKGDIPSALAESSRIADEYRIIDLLIKNAKQHPGTGHYYETKEYYFSLQEEKITEYPVLMAGMSMLYSLILQPEKSEEWYQKLCDFSKGHNCYPERQKEAKSRIAYLDIALPHRGVKKITKILTSSAKLCLDRSITIPEVSVTSNLPSVMNGGKDFCGWSRIDKELAKVMRKPIEIVLGKHGVGLVNIALAESYFEKSSADDYEIITLINDGYALAETKGKIELCFAALGIRNRLNIWHNQLRLAEQQTADFLIRVQKEHADQLLPNIYAMQNWMNLLKGNLTAVKEWIEQAPNEISDFYILDRYRYLMKLRSYIALEQYDNAWNLLDRLDFYFTRYDRNYMGMESKLLRAILCYRIGRDQWKELYTEAYEQAESYHFAWLLAKEGIAVLPLFRAWEADRGEEDAFRKLVRQKTETMAFQYPAYLEREKVLSEPLSEMEKRILQLHSSGMDTRRIMELCQITERTLKFHNSNLYRKLDVNNKSEAILAAKQLGIVN